MSSGKTKASRYPTPQSGILHALRTEYGVKNPSFALATEINNCFEITWIGTGYYPSRVVGHFNRRANQLQQLKSIISKYDNTWIADKADTNDTISNNANTANTNLTNDNPSDLQTSNPLNTSAPSYDDIGDGAQIQKVSKSTQTEQKQDVEQKEDEENMSIPTIDPNTPWDEYVAVMIYQCQQLIISNFAKMCLCKDYFLFISIEDDLFRYIDNLKQFMPSSEFHKFMNESYEKYGSKLNKLFDAYIFGKYLPSKTDPASLNQSQMRMNIDSVHQQQRNVVKRKRGDII